MNKAKSNDFSRARTFLILFLIIFGFGRFSVWMRRPVYPPQMETLDRITCPPAIDIRVVNAVDSPVGDIHLFKAGTTVSQALNSLNIKVDPHRSNTVLPRACVLERASEGWTVRPMSQTERWIWQIPMDLNTSSSDDLQRISGIGPVLADRIARYISEKVWIRNVDSLIRVKGVGPVKLETLKKYLEVEGGSD
jgi:hypothetical protein